MARGIQCYCSSVLHGDGWNSDEVVRENFGGFHLTNTCKNKNKELNQKSRISSTKK